MDFFCPQENNTFKANKDNLTSDDDVCENEFPSSDDCEDDLIDSVASIVMNIAQTLLLKYHITSHLKITRKMDPQIEMFAKN